MVNVSKLVSITVFSATFLVGIGLFSPLNAWLDHFFDFHLDVEAIETPPRDNDWVIEAERDLCESYRNDKDCSSSPGDNGGRDFSPNNDR